MAEFDERGGGEGWSAVALLYKPARKTVYREGATIKSKGMQQSKKVTVANCINNELFPYLCSDTVDGFSPRCNHISCAACGGVYCEKVREKKRIWIVLCLMILV
jgi:hypothetical protein